MHQHYVAERKLGPTFAFAVALNLLYLVLEAAAGLWIGSLALLADAGHNLSDVLGLLLAWGGYALSRVSPTTRRTYGWRGSTILAALFNGLILLVAVGGIAWEAVQRFFEPAEVAGGTVVLVSGVGFCVNGLTALLFLGGQKEDLNVRGAFLHMAADAGVSLGVAGAGVLIWRFGWQWADPVISLVVAAIIFAATWELLKESVNLAVQAVPAHVDPEAVRDYLASLPGVEDVHDLHIWGMSTTETALTAHLVKPQIEDEDEMLHEATDQLHDRFGIVHVTLQVERSATASGCRQGTGRYV